MQHKENFEIASFNNNELTKSYACLNQSSLVCVMSYSHMVNCNLDEIR